MNFLSALIECVTELKRLKRSFRSHRLVYLCAENGFLTVAVDAVNTKEFVGVQTAIDESCEFKGVIPAGFTKLLEYIEDNATHYGTGVHGEDDDRHYLRFVCQGNGYDSFDYRLELKPIHPAIKTIHPLILAPSIDDSTVNSVIIKEQTQTIPNLENKTMIAITGNYFDDLAVAIETGIVAKQGGKNPKKADLYAAIDVHNDGMVKRFKSSYVIEASEPIALSDMIAEVHKETPKPTVTKAKPRNLKPSATGSAIATIAPEVKPEVAPADAYSALLGQWKQTKVDKQAAKIAASQPKVRVKPENYGKSGKSLDKAEVWSADRIRTVKASSQMGLVLSRMFDNNGIQQVEHESLGLTKGQFSQAIGSISEAGYGIAKNGLIYTVILPEGMDAPKLK